MLIDKVYFWFQTAKIGYALAAAWATVFSVFKAGLKLGKKPFKNRPVTKSAKLALTINLNRLVILHLSVYPEPVFGYFHITMALSKRPNQASNSMDWERGKLK